MNPKILLLGLALVLLPKLTADQQGVVSLSNQTLNIRQLVEEAGRQTEVKITIDLREDDGPTLPYDCHSTLREVLDGVRGYFLHQTGMELLETWKDEKTVHLHFKTMETEIIAVQVEGRAPVLAPKRKKTQKRNSFKKWFTLKATDGRGQRNQDEPMGETAIKHLDLKEKEATPKSVPLEDAPETIPTRLKVETLSSDSFAMSPKEKEAMSMGSEKKPVEASKNDLMELDELPSTKTKDHLLREDMMMPEVPKKKVAEAPKSEVIELDELPSTKTKDHLLKEDMMMSEAPKKKAVEVPKSEVMELEELPMDLLDTKPGAKKKVKVAPPKKQTGDIKNDPVHGEKKSEKNNSKVTQKGELIPLELMDLEEVKESKVEKKLGSEMQAAPKPIEKVNASESDSSKLESKNVETLPDL